jgi:hypothetical protein
MTITEYTVPVCIDSLATQVSQRLAQRERMTNTEAIRYVMSTKTYDLLIDPESCLYLESPGYVFDMLDAEIKGDWDRWMEI